MKKQKIQPKTLITPEIPTSKNISNSYSKKQLKRAILQPSPTVRALNNQYILQQQPYTNHSIPQSNPNNKTYQTFSQTIIYDLKKEFLQKIDKILRKINISIIKTMQHHHIQQFNLIGMQQLEDQIQLLFAKLDLIQTLPINPPTTKRNALPQNIKQQSEQDQDSSRKQNLKSQRQSLLKTKQIQYELQKLGLQRQNQQLRTHIQELQNFIQQNLKLEEYKSQNKDKNSLDYDIEFQALKKPASQVDQLRLQVQLLNQKIQNYQKICESSIFSPKTASNVTASSRFKKLKINSVAGKAIKQFVQIKALQTYTKQYLLEESFKMKEFLKKLSSEWQSLIYNWSIKMNNKSPVGNNIYKQQLSKWQQDIFNVIQNKIQKILLMDGNQQIDQK